MDVGARRVVRGASDVRYPSTAQVLFIDVAFTCVDEQPGSWMFYEADLKTDRLSANEERFIGRWSGPGLHCLSTSCAHLFAHNFLIMQCQHILIMITFRALSCPLTSVWLCNSAWNYRQLEFCPAEVLPGFAMHQTDRDPTALEIDPRSNNHARARDFDFLGYRYSVLSSVGTGGLNNVMNMLPARDIQEFSLFPAEDIAFVKGWLSWADEHVSWLLRSKVLSGQPSAGKLDATAMIVDNQGAVFVYNPTARASEFTLMLDSAAGFTCDAHTKLLVRLIGSSERTAVPHNVDLKPCNSQIVLSVPPTTALAFDFAVHADHQLIVLGAAAHIEYNPTTQTVILDNMQAAAGAEQQLTVLLPSALANQHTISRVVIGNQSVKFEPSVHSSGHASLSLKGKWAGEQFVKEIGNATGFSGGAFEATFNVPAAAIEQLQDLNRTYPLKYDLDPEGNDDANVPWLAPGRLLIFVKYRPLQNDTFNVTGSIDSVPLLMRKAYNTIVRSPQRFIGYWADVTAHVKPGQQQKLSLVLPREPTSYHIQSGFINAGNDLGTAAATVAQAEVHCNEDRDCVGFTVEKKADTSTPCAEVVGPQKILYKSGGATGGAGSPSWCTALKPPVLDGVFFDNVQTISSNVFEVY